MLYILYYLNWVAHSVATTGLQWVPSTCTKTIKTYSERPFLKSHLLFIYLLIIIWGGGGVGEFSDRGPPAPLVTPLIVTDMHIVVFCLKIAVDNVFCFLSFFKDTKQLMDISFLMV